MLELYYSPKNAHGATEALLITPKPDFAQDSSAVAERRAGNSGKTRGKKRGLKFWRAFFHGRTVT